MNSGNSKTSDPHRLVFNLADKINLKKSHKLFALSNLSINYTPKNIKKKNYLKLINLKYQLQHGIINVNNLTFHNLYQISEKYTQEDIPNI